MKNIIKLLVFWASSLISPLVAHAAPAPSDKTAYDFAFEAPDGQPLPLSAYRGKVLLVVNTASKCGFTPQYEGLEALHKRYGKQGLVVIGVPSNDFNQEPNSSADAKKFCLLNYGVSFPITAKAAVTGEQAHPFFHWVSEVLGAAPKWNFQKYLINRQGQPVDYFMSMTGPESDKVTSAIEKLIAENAINSTE